MSAEILRRAAAEMRDRAEAAISASGDDPWKSDGIAWNDNRGTVYMVGAGPVNVCDAITEEQADHIAGMSPAVALAVADWLEGAALRAEMHLRAMVGTFGAEHGPDFAAVNGDALRVARAYLGESA